MDNPKYKNIVDHYQNCYQKFGDNHLGVDWPNEEDLKKRYQVALGLIKKEDKNPTLLDFGCGTAGLYQFSLNAKNGVDIKYSGLDLGELYINRCLEKYPNNDFYHVDILKENNIPQFDYIIMNGVFTEKRDLSFEEMLIYFKQMIIAIYSRADKGIAFNVMSKAVDWEREDLFHLGTDVLIDFLTKEVSRNF
ncbi:MAG: class I SAM-dependent methyltransferase, partial [Flavobacteriales bacterium]|nr:class I SAM-dependent methyltransferase [Flavobacteriales bacterium]